MVRSARSGGVDYGQFNGVCKKVCAADMYGGSLWWSSRL